MNAKPADPTEDLDQQAIDRIAELERKRDAIDAEIKSVKERRREEAFKEGLLRG